MLHLLRRLLFVLLVAGGAAPALAADDPMLGTIAGMDVKSLDALVTKITVSVGKDSLGLKDLAATGSCLELLKDGNSFALGYGYLGAADTRVQNLTGEIVLGMRAHIAQSRVLVFAARVRAEEYLQRGCADFVVPADLADDPRYQKLPKILDSEFTGALIDARSTAEANLAATILAGKSKDCRKIASSVQSVALMVPYLQKLADDTKTRPDALGPLASRRALTILRNQLVGTANRLSAQFTPLCAASDSPAKAPAPVAGADQPPAETPAAPASPATP